jgi:hypothetical protein
VVTNGMSQHSRNERNANSGIVVNVTLADLEPYGEAPGDPLAGVAFQRYWEQRAFQAGGASLRAPAQRLADFLAGCPSSAGGLGPGHGAKTAEGDGPAQAGAVSPSYQPGVVFGDLESCLPEFVTRALREALPQFDKSVPGFCRGDAVLTGVETRTSSPLRILRHPQLLESTNTPGLYPAGEGAGYAGGILSAAIDGIKVAEQLALAVLSRRP